MKLKANLAWKLVVGVPEEGVDYCAANKHFNVKTGKTFLKKVGGISSLDFLPYTFEPTNVFYHAIEPCKLENGFVGKKMPFTFEVVKAERVKKPLNIKIHRYTSKLVILSVSVNSVEFSGSINDLQEFMQIEYHNEIFNLVRTLCGIISSGGRNNTPIQQKPKVYPYFEFESVNDNDFISDEAAVELLTRHKNPKLEIIESVISKNKDHQLDNNSILIDRQGILARYSQELGEYQSVQRKYESSHYLFELAIALSNILDDGDFLTLNTEQRVSISKLIKNPKVVFIKSVTAYKTWLLLLEEFKLKELYDLVATSNHPDEDLQKTLEPPSVLDNKEWSDLKKWSMGILSVLLISSILWAAGAIFKENSPFANKSVSLFTPIDGSHHQKNNDKIEFNWEEVKNAKKYILIIERLDSNNKWLPQNGGRYVIFHNAKSAAINEDGRFKWKVIARDIDEDEIGTSVWYYFDIKTKITPNKKMQSMPKTRG